MSTNFSYSYSHSRFPFGGNAAIHRPSGLLNPAPHPQGSWAGQAPTFGLSRPAYDGIFQNPGMSTFGNPFSYMMDLMGAFLNSGFQNLFSGFPSPHAGQPRHLPDPQNFWGNSNVHHRSTPGHTRSHTFGGHFSNNGQFSGRGHAFQTMNNGIGSHNHQVSYGGSAFQQVQSGQGSTHSQHAFGRATQRINTNSYSVNQQLHEGRGRGVQRSRINGVGGQSTQISTSQQGANQRVIGGARTNATQNANPNSNSTQLAHLGSGSGLSQVGGRHQTAHLREQGGGTVYQEAGNRGGNQLATTRGQGNIVQQGSNRADNQETRVHGRGNAVQMNSGGGRDNNETTVTGRNNVVEMNSGRGADSNQANVSGSNNRVDINSGSGRDQNEANVSGHNNQIQVTGSRNNTVVNDSGNGNRVSFDNSHSRNTVNFGDDADNKVFRVGHSRGNQNFVNTEGGNDRLRVDIANHDNHHDVHVDMGQGDDTTVLNSGPRNGDASVSFDGGEGCDVFQYGGADNVSFYQGDQLIHGSGKGPRVELNGYESFRYKNDDGKWVTQNLQHQ